MSGGHFDCANERIAYEMGGKWEDAEVNALFDDLFVDLRGGKVRDGDGGLAQSLDFYLSCDVCEETYREDVRLFKARWFRRTPKNRVEFYQDRIQDYADRCKREMGEL